MEKTQLFGGMAIYIGGIIFTLLHGMYMVSAGPMEYNAGITPADQMGNDIIFIANHVYIIDFIMCAVFTFGLLTMIYLLFKGENQIGQNKPQT